MTGRRTVRLKEQAVGKRDAIDGQKIEPMRGIGEGGSKWTYTKSW